MPYLSKNTWRISEEASFDEATPEDKIYSDLPAIKESEGLQPTQAVIYPAPAVSNRSMNPASPIAGADEPDMGSLEMIFYPDMLLLPFKGVFGSMTPTETPGTAALAAATFKGMTAQALDTEPTSTERLEFTIASSTAASGASIQILEGGTLVETVSIPDSGSSVDGVYTSLGNHAAAITITTVGTVTAGTLAVNGVASTSYAFTVADTLVSFAIEQMARPEAAALTDSEFFPGCVFPSLELNFDRSDTEGILAVTVTINGLWPVVATSTTFDNAAAQFFKPFAAWYATVQIDDVDWCEVESATITLTPNVNLYAVACGSKQPDNAKLGFFEVTGSLTIIPSDPNADDRWTQYKNVTEAKLNIIFTSSQFVSGSTPYSLDLELPQFSIEEYARAVGNELDTADLTIRGVYNTGETTVAKATIVAG